MRKNGIKDFKWIFYRQNLRKLVKIGFLALVGFFFQKKWGTNKIKSVSTYPWNVKWILLFSNFDFHILSPPPTFNLIEVEVEAELGKNGWGGGDGVGYSWVILPPPSVVKTLIFSRFFSDEGFPKIIWLLSKHLLIRTALLEQNYRYTHTLLF